MDKLFAITGSVSALLGVVAGAFGAHGLKDRLSPEMLEVFETAVRYQMYHAFALLFAAWAVTRWPEAIPAAAGWSFIAGTVLFSGRSVRAESRRDPVAGRRAPPGRRGLHYRLASPGLRNLPGLKRKETCA